MKRMIVAAIVFLSAPVIAQNVTNQIDIIGLIPGVSSAAQFKAASIPTPDYRAYRGDSSTFQAFEIGGFTLGCHGEFEGDKMQKFSCTTGYAESNIDIHNVLKRGFQEKLGSPFSDTSSTVRNGLGTEFNVNEVMWADKLGNVLLLKSMDDKIDKGSLTLFSSSLVKKVQESNAQQDRARKF